MDLTSNRWQDVVGQFPQLKTYNHGLMIFPLNDGISEESVVDELRTALARVVAAVPWLSERVVGHVLDTISSATFNTVPWAENVRGAKQLYVKDLKDACASFETISRAGGPVSLLDGNILCPFPGFPLSYDEEKIGPAPVVAVQASLIKGGLILCLSNQHNLMDATGVFAFATLLATAMSPDGIPEHLISQAMIDRSRVIPLLDPGQPVRDHSHYFKKIASSQQNQPLSSSAKWCLFRISQRSAAEIEAAASDPLDFDPAISHISTNDALCAFYWKRLAAIRLSNGSASRHSTSKFLRAIDARSAVGQPQGYMGQMIYHAATSFTFGELVDDEDLSLSALASRMRVDLNESNNEWAVRSYATFLAGVPDKSQLLYGGGLDLNLDVGSSAMTHRSTASGHFGILGKPALVRRPDLTPVPSMLYFFPPDTESAQLPVLVCLNEPDLTGLRADPEWNHYAEFIG
ncbi:hypothetical protein M406DRAFT_37368 [Cryphonectria parasitica EP155]|uniref:Trichothecene 3-O-acetyltransferase-like N-terminal domain-containing protein n=1 Tax=Cryphonectria parasitica (strain ATCC 38755 / EP155) TaxID=660469 RepID=A0A9P5CQV4_CRYP1|nr:uncharacterized protein M406DRAFT_37368 [Cryphonectria parasitica EP155]KAF3766611.1 hypothetical protein M406DRAFT_37368 [Cryphonectria parasitica EP155]